MATFISMPKLGMTMESGVLTKWLKQEGEAVVKGEAVFELETDKLSTAAEAPEDGVLRKILVPEGTEVPILKHVGILAGADEDISLLLEDREGPGDERTAQAAQREQADPRPQEKMRDSGRIAASPRARAVAKELGVDLARIPLAPGRVRITEKDVRDWQERCSAQPKASPLAVKVARDLDLDLNDIHKDGRIMTADLAALLERRGGGSEATTQRETRKPMNGMRRAIARNMQDSHMTSPTVTYNTSVDLGVMGEWRVQLAEAGLKVSYTDLLVWFVSRVLRQFPLLNSSVEGEDIVFKHYVNMGVAVALEEGLVVPNIPDADQKTLTQISSELKELSEKARGGTLSMDRMQGGTFTITNLGMFGIESFSPIINQPEVAILGVNAIRDTLVIRDGVQMVRPLMELSLTADHRVVDGAVAARFLQSLRAVLERPALMLM